MSYKFYGNDTRPLSPKAEYAKVTDQRRLYDLLSEVWCAYTCAPRLRPEWSAENKTLGQCSITAFLAQDIFGGEVYGIPLEGGGYHCYNAVDDVVFDLASEQFGGKPLRFDRKNPQSREAHFADAEKYERYLYLKAELLKKLR